MSYKDRVRWLGAYFIFCYIVVLGISASYLKSAYFENPVTSAFACGVWLTYGVIYLLPALGITLISHWLISRKQAGKNFSKKANIITGFIALVSTGLTHLLIYTDQFLFGLFDFHLNGFVWNLITTPGGIESMGGSSYSFVIFGVMGTALFLGQALILWTLAKFWQYAPTVSKKMYIYIIVFFVFAALGERVTYGVSQLQGNGVVMAAATAFPFYQPMTLKSLAKKLGYNPPRKVHLNAEDGKIVKLAYPRKAINVKPPENPPNIVWLVAESLRFDMLSPEIMPASWEFAQKSQWFTKHYSGGNGTRMGMFSMFYGLYGMYWFPFLYAKQAPVIMDVIQQQNYQLGLYTSAKFTYPEFDRTIFANINSQYLNEYNAKSPWQSDEKNAQNVIDFIQNRDVTRPFMTFMFFESTHARYSFPEKSVIRKDYLKDFNYATLSPEKHIVQIKNRYINAAHHLDAQIKKILDFLTGEKLLENTLVIITGDHGEEFMEKGRWGHNSKFTEEQTRVPMIFWIPKTQPQKINHMTSHLDVVPTIMPYLGAQNPPEDYCLGMSMMGSKKREFTVLTDWNQAAYVSREFKLVIPMRGAGMFQQYVTTSEDALLDPLPENFWNAHQSKIIGLMQDMNKFKYAHND